MKTVRTTKFLLTTALCLTLVACKSSEELVSERYGSAIELLENGDVDRAIVQLRSVFEIDGTHFDSRWKLAELLIEERQDVQGGYAQLLRLAEQYPDDLEVRIRLSSLAFERRNFEEFERHSEAAARIAPDDLRVKAIVLAEEYRDLVADSSDTAGDDLINRARLMLGETGPDFLLLTLLTDHAVRSNDFLAALDHLNVLAEIRPNNRNIQNQRLAVIAELGDDDAVEEQLLAMAEKFSDDIEVKATVLRFYLSKDRADDAEEFLRILADPSAEDPSAMFDLIRFVAELRGEDAALEEIERAIQASPNPNPYRALRANFWFNRGDQEDAIKELEDIIANAGEDEDLSGVKIALSRMLVSQDNEVGARRLIEEVIADDPLNGTALKLRAGWLIESDQVDLAVADLRTALDADADDSDAMTLLATAYTRLGRHELARDFLSLAADASNNAPTETIRYASRLIAEERYLPAEDILLASLRLNAGNLELLQLLGQLYITMDDLPRAQQVADTLRRQNTGQAIGLANAIEAELVNLREGTEEALAYLEKLVDESGGDLNSQLVLLRGRLSAGDIEGATSLADELLESDPTNLALRSASASIRAVGGDFQSAEEMFREVIKDSPDVARNWLELSRVLVVQDKIEDARVIIDNGLETLPNDPGLLWAKASVLQLDGDIEGAIEVYETMYEQNTNSLVVANNLASLLATYRDDDESLERAFVLGRRLLETEVPQFQDTIGWILHRRGEHEQSLPYLESAAAALISDPIVQFHYGMSLAANGRTAEAVEQLQRAVNIAGPDDPREQFAIARDEIIRLQSQ